MKRSPTHATGTSCRRCGVTIRPSDLCTDPRTMEAVWIDQDGWDHCDGTSDSHEPASACQVHDEIVEWTTADGRLKVREGDLILREGRLELIEWLHFEPTENLMVRVGLAGRCVGMYVQPDELVAVRSYLVEEA